MLDVMGIDSVGEFRIVVILSGGLEVLAPVRLTPGHMGHRTKNADVTGRPEAFRRVGLLFAEPTARGGSAFDQSSDISNPHCRVRSEESKGVVDISLAGP